MDGTATMPVEELAVWQASGWCLPVPIEEVSALNNLLDASMTTGLPSGSSSDTTVASSPSETSRASSRTYGHRAGGSSMLQQVSVTAAVVSSIDKASPMAAALMQHALNSMVGLKALAREYDSAPFDHAFLGAFPLRQF
jgi:hypothetical protein